MQKDKYLSQNNGWISSICSGVKHNHFRARSLFFPLNIPSPASPLKSPAVNSKVNWWIGFDDIEKGHGAGTWTI